MLKLKQTISVEEYRELFEELTEEVPHVTSDVIEVMFLNGMKKRLQEKVLRFRPVGLDDIVGTAKLIEEQEAEKSGYSSKTFNRTTSAPTLNYNSKRND